MTLQLSEIYIYPIKSLSGTSLQSAQVLEKGLEHDRRWVLIDEDHVVITQRKHHHMALLKVEILDGKLIVNSPLEDLEELFIPMTPFSGPEVAVHIWGDVTAGIAAPVAINDWFSKALSIPCTLVHMSDTIKRPIKKEWSVNDEHVSYADGYPYLMIGQSSLDDLNSRMEETMEIQRFRPNFVFTGGSPYQEDRWEGTLKMGTVLFKGLKPCVRCVLTTIDPKTAEKGKEPLKTLATYRKNDRGIIFGQHLIALEEGAIHVGDEIFANP